MIKTAHLVIAATAATMTSTALTADAQDSFFDRNRYVSVTERSQPEYDPVPIRLGALEARARLRTGAGYRSNLFASTTDETSDGFALIAPSVDLVTTWSRHEFGASLAAEHTEYIDTGSESATDVFARAFGGVDVTSELGLVAAVIGEHTNEPRASAASDPAAAEPVEVDRIGVEGGVNYERGRIRLRGRLSADTYDYSDVPLNGGGTRDQDFRDRDDMTGSVRLSYAPRRDWAVFAEGSVTSRDYDPPSGPTQPNRDSDGKILRVGTNFELPVLLRGDIAVGYHQFEYDDPAAGDVSGLSVEANASWFVTQLTTLSGTASRRVIDPGLQATAAATQTAVGVNVDHELRRNWLLNAGVDFTSFEFENLDRDDDRFDINVGSLWKFNRNASFRLSYRFSEQDSTDRPFTDNRVMATLTLTP